MPVCCGVNKYARVLRSSALTWCVLQSFMLVCMPLVDAHAVTLL